MGYNKHPVVFYYNPDPYIPFFCLFLPLKKIQSKHNYNVTMPALYFKIPIL